MVDGLIFLGMSDEQEKQKIRDIIDTWLKASAAGDLERVLPLMAEDVVFLRGGMPEMTGREAYAVASRAMAGKVRFEGRPNIKEIQVAGEYAYVWNYLTVTVVTPLPDGAPKNMAGNILSIFRKEPDGMLGALFRDANNMFVDACLRLVRLRRLIDIFSSARSGMSIVIAGFCYSKLR